MEPVIGEIQPTAGPARLPDGRGIGSDPSDRMVAKDLIDVLGKPSRVARFTDDVAREAPPESRQESRGGRAVERQAWRKLKQQRPELGPEARHLTQEAGEDLVHIGQAPLMRDGPRHLHGEPESGRHRSSPFFVGCNAMRPVEGRVDLDGGEALRVPLQMAAVSREVRRVGFRQAPARSADHDRLWCGHRLPRRLVSRARQMRGG